MICTLKTKKKDTHFKNKIFTNLIRQDRNNDRSKSKKVNNNSDKNLSII